MAAERDRLFHGIYEATKKMTVADASAYFKHVQNRTPALRNTSLEAFAGYWLQADAKEREQNPRTSCPVQILSLLNPCPGMAKLIPVSIGAALRTAKELWDAVCAWEPDPLRLPADAGPVTTIMDLLDSPSFEPIPLGKLTLNNGQYMCALEPISCLSPDEDGFCPDQQRFKLSASNLNGIRAIKYADGHPSEASYHLTSKGETVKPGPKLATEDNILRRYMALGYVLMWIDGDWVKTGHALVIDASRGRKCHPWFVLAANWTTDDEDYFFEHNSQRVKLPKKVKWNDSKAFGVLPGNKNRTPIAKLKYCQGTKAGNEKFVSHFGENFSFEFERMGKRSGDLRSEWGPDLAEVMYWWWDQQKKEEVCYTYAGLPWIRYNPATREYDGPHRALQEIGNIIEDFAQPAKDKVPLESRMGNVNLGPSGPSSSHGRGPGHGHGQKASTAWSSK